MDRSLRTALSIIALVVVGYLGMAGFSGVMHTAFRIPYIILLALVLAAMAAFAVRLALNTREKEVDERHAKAAKHHAALRRDQR
jgi:TRAP-type C4-dicarboxylate transport system permease small subunit